MRRWRLSSSSSTTGLPVSETGETRRIALKIQYLGSQFCGWQWQTGKRTVQQALEEAIGRIARHPVRCHAAGRTDTGVHASGQVVHFETTKRLPGLTWVHGINSALPEDIAVRAAAAVPADWHARFSALWREYRYLIYNDPIPELFVRRSSWFYSYRPLDVESMATALASLCGEHDLRAFRRAGSRRRHSLVRVLEVECAASGVQIAVRVRASGFLYGMMRLLVGSLVEVGGGRWSVEYFQTLWKSGNRQAIKYAAPPEGLCLIGVGYPFDPFVQNGNQTD